MRQFLFVGAVLLFAGSLGAQQQAVPLDTLQVSASSRASTEMAAVTRATEVIGAEEIRQMPARTVAEVLQWALGVDLMPRSAALADVAIRGSSFEQVLVMVDGVRVSDAQTGHFDLDLAVPLDQVERIEVLRGPASTLHGADAMGGVIHIVTRRGGGSRVRLDGGSFQSAGLAAAHGFSAARGSVDLAADLRRSDGHRPGTDYEIGLGRAAFSLPLAGRTLRADVGHAVRGFGADGFYAPFPSYEETRTTTASVGFRAPAGARLALEPVVSFRRHRDDFILKRADPAFYRNQHETRQLGGELSARYALLPRLRLGGGLEGYADQLESARLGERTERRAALFGEVAVGQTGSATAIAGLRGDWHEAHGLFLSPALSAAWWPSSGTRLRSSVGRALRTPTWTERFYRDPANVGDPELAPERAWSAEVGFDAYLPGGAKASAAAFVRHASDLIDWARPEGSSGLWTTRNVESARFRGLETEVALDDLLGLRWTGRGSWLSVEASEAPGLVSKYALRPLVETLSLSAERRSSGGLGGSLRALWARRAGEAGYLRADARASLQLTRLRFLLDLNNVGDTAYPDITGAAAPGRSVVVGVEWRAR